MGVMRTFLPAWTKGPVVAQAPWDNPPLGLWIGGVPICGFFGVNKTPTKVVDLGRDLWFIVSHYNKHAQDSKVRPHTLDLWHALHMLI